MQNSPSPKILEELVSELNELGELNPSECYIDATFVNGRKFRRYKHRWIVERFFAWMKNKRRLLNRWEFHPKNSLGFVRISAAFLLRK